MLKSAREGFDYVTLVVSDGNPFDGVDGRGFNLDQRTDSEAPVYPSPARVRVRSDPVAMPQASDPCSAPQSRGLKSLFER